MDPFQNIRWEDIRSLPYNSGFFSLVGNSALFTIFGIKTSSIVIPYDGYQQKVLTANNDEWAILASGVNSLLELNSESPSKI